MKTKDEYIESLASELKEWSVQIDILTAKAENLAAQVRIDYIEELSILRAKLHAAAEKLKELEDESGYAWESVKETTDKVWDDIRVGLADAASKFK